MPFCEQAIPRTASGAAFAASDDVDVLVYAVMALALFIGVPVLAWHTERDDWAPRWARTLARRTRRGWVLEALLIPVLWWVVSATLKRAPPTAGCLPPYLALLGGLASFAGLWVFAWLLHRARHAPEAVSLLGTRARWLQVGYACVGLACQACAALYFAVTCGLVSAPAVVRSFGLTVYATQTPLHFAPVLFALVELGSAGGRPVSWTAIRTTALTGVVVCAGVGWVGMDWPLSRTAEVLAALALILFAAPLVTLPVPDVHEAGGAGYAPPTS